MLRYDLTERLSAAHAMEAASSPLTSQDCHNRILQAVYRRIIQQQYFKPPLETMQCQTDVLSTGFQPQIASLPEHGLHRRTWSASSALMTLLSVSILMQCSCPNAQPRFLILTAYVLVIISVLRH